MSHKKRKVSYSTYSAELLAAADGKGTGNFSKDVICELFWRTLLKHEPMVDSKSLFETITTPQKPVDYRPRKTVARIRVHFDSSELNSVPWIPGSQNYADVLAKCNLALYKKLSLFFSSGY